MLVVTVIIMSFCIRCIRMALGCYLDLCGGNFAGAADGGGKGGVSPKGLFTAGELNYSEKTFIEIAPFSLQRFK